MYIIEEANGTLIPVKSNPAVPVEMLKKVHNLLKSGISIEDIVDRLRTETFPMGYPCHPWLSRCVLYVDIVCNRYRVKGSVLWIIKPTTPRAQTEGDGLYNP